MTALKARPEGADDAAPEAAPSAFSAPLSASPVETIKVRRDFLAAARARKWAAPSMVVQGRDRKDDGPARVGFTCSKKVGNAVARNRAKRRLRAAAAEVLPRLARPGWDYVLIGKRDATAARAWPALLADLETALARLHAPRKPRA